ncbi:MAG: hypothetical protein WA810_02030 [Maribacter sp.]
MKNYIHVALTLFATVGALFISSAQEFTETRKYKVAMIRASEQEKGTSLLDIVLDGQEDTSKTTLVVTDYELLSNVQLSILSNPGLEGVVEIVKVRLAYYACCSRTEDQYFMVTHSNAFVALPRIETQYGYDPIRAVSYIFPNQAFGQEGTVLRAELHYNETYIVNDIQVLQSFFWNDDDFDREDASIAINE